MADPADPVNPVSHASRSSEAGTYSFWWRSARGTIHPVSPRRASSVRNAATRGALAARSVRSSKDWNLALYTGLMLPLRHVHDHPCQQIKARLDRIGVEIFGIF